MGFTPAQIQVIYNNVRENNLEKLVEFVEKNDLDTLLSKEK